MSGGRGLRREMAGRPSEGGVSGAGEEPRAAPEGAVDLLAQARKALALRSPFDAEEAGPRVVTLPAGLAAFLAKHTDGRRKHKKPPEGEPGEKPPAPAPVAASTVWDHTEEFFRPLTSADIDLLVPNLPFSSGQLDSCFLIPFPGSFLETDKKDGPCDAAEVQLSSNTASEKAEAVREEEKGAEVENVQLVKPEEEPMEIDEVGTSSDALPEREEDESSSFSWLLGAKERFILTSERPNKKRKLLGGDAGLEHLLVLPHSHEEASTSCDLCCSQDSTLKTNKLLSCYSCKAGVHQKCYGVHEVPKGSWSCSYCKHLEKDGDDRSSRPCVLCPKEGGALKPVESHSGRGGDGSTTKFAHLFCSLWIPEVYVEDIKAMEPVMNIRGVQETRKKLVCNVCKVKHGACVRCSHGMLFEFLESICSI